MCGRRGLALSDSRIYTHRSWRAHRPCIWSVRTHVARDILSLQPAMNLFGTQCFCSAPACASAIPPAGTPRAPASTVRHLECSCLHRSAPRVLLSPMKNVTFQTLRPRASTSVSPAMSVAATKTESGTPPGSAQPHGPSASLLS